jgi:hypothetical protein
MDTKWVDAYFAAQPKIDLIHPLFQNFEKKLVNRWLTPNAKSAVTEDVRGAVDSESITKDVRCMKYEKKKPKLREVSEVVSSFDPFCANFETRLHMSRVRPKTRKRQLMKARRNLPSSCGARQKCRSEAEMRP